MKDAPNYEVFKKGSRNYFYSSVLFDRKTRDAITDIYAFVRTADDFVDEIPQKIAEYQRFKGDFINFYYNGELKWYANAVEGMIIRRFVYLVKEKGIEISWIKAFFDSMDMDIEKKEYMDIDEIINYVYGSAEVIGLMLAKIMGLSNDSFYYAKMLGRSMQYANFIRDYNEDMFIGRLYLPKKEMIEMGIVSARPQSQEEIKNFINFFKKQIRRFYEWQKEAEKGFIYIPRKYFVPIKTASDMYVWTIRQIDKNPLIVFEKKIKPSVFRILAYGIKNLLFSYFKILSLKTK
ncbi:MAG: phytoene synthase [Patescibacteria group bacterium]|nr:MAG: phytoene synthase [Patescibacteria group bacterium]